jgi:hypothetical protein
MNPLQLVTSLLGRSPKSLDLPTQVHTTARGEKTIVAIDHLIPSSGTVADGWRVTTRKLYLPTSHFDRRVRATINQASLERGRRIFCIDRESGEAIAALSYHIDKRKRMPVMLTALAMRIDATPARQLYDQSRGAAFLLTQYVHEIASQAGRPGAVHIDADNLDAIRDLNDLGFQRAPDVPGLRVSGTHLRQLPLS